MSCRPSMRSAPSSRIGPAGISVFATATSSSGRRMTALSWMATVAMSVSFGRRLDRTRPLDAQHPGRLGLDLDRRVIDAEARVEALVELAQQPLALAHVLDDDVGAHRLATGGQRPDVEIVHPPHPADAPHRLLDLARVEVGRRALEEHVHRLPAEPPRPR